jgi:hypothetical protein
MADAAAVGADPEIAMVAEGYRVDVVGGEPVGSREILEALAVKMADAAVSGEPEISPRIGENAVHLIMGQTFAGRKGSELATVKAADAVVAAGEPQVPVSILVDGAHAAGCETVFFGVGGEALPVGGEPDIASPVLVHGKHTVTGQAAVGGVGEDLLSVVELDSPFPLQQTPEAEPQPARVVREDEVHPAPSGRPSSLPNTVETRAS